MPDSGQTRMDDSLKELYEALDRELTWMFLRWNQYSQLFKSPTRIALLNSSAPFFFSIIQEVLWFETLLGISRLAGPASTAGKPNLSAQRLRPLLEERGLRQSIEPFLDEAVSASAFVTDWRNRHIAHRDLDLSLSRSVRALPEATQPLVDRALDCQAALLNALSKHYDQSSTAYRFAAPIGDAASLLYVIRDGLRREELRQKRLEDGQYDPSDWDDELPAI